MRLCNAARSRLLLRSQQSRKVEPMRGAMKDGAAPFTVLCHCCGGTALWKGGYTAFDRATISEPADSATRGRVGLSPLVSNEALRGTDRCRKGVSDRGTAYSRSGPGGETYSSTGIPWRGGAAGSRLH